MAVVLVVLLCHAWAVRCAGGVCVGFGRAPPALLHLFAVGCGSRATDGMKDERPLETQPCGGKWLRAAACGGGDGGDGQWCPPQQGLWEESSRRGRPSAKLQLSTPHLSCAAGRELVKQPTQERFPRSETAFARPVCHTACMDWRTDACNGQRRLSSCLPM